MNDNSIYKKFDDFKGDCGEFAIEYLKTYYVFGKDIDSENGAKFLWNIIDRYITNVNAMMNKDDIKAEFEKELDLYIETLGGEKLSAEDRQEVKEKIKSAFFKGAWIKTAWQKLKKILNINKVESEEDSQSIITILDMREEDRNAMECAFREIEIAEIIDRIDKIDEKKISDIKEKYQFVYDAFFSPFGSIEEMVLQKICAVDILCQHGQVADVNAEDNPCFNALAAANFTYDKISELKLGLFEAVAEAGLMSSSDAKFENN